MKPKKLNCLEGVRALACIGIVLCHLRGAFFPNSGLAARIAVTPFNYILSGDTALRIMFILSGFVLSYKYFRTGQTDTLQADAVKRYFRLALPTAVVVLLVYAMMRLNLLYHAQVAPLTGSENFLGLFNRFEPQLKTAVIEGFWGSIYGGSSTYVGPLWTMTVEMLGSYLIFAVVAILKSKRARYLFYAVYLLVFPAYYIYFVVGMLTADLYTQEEGLNAFFQKHRYFTVLLHLTAWYYIGAVDNLDVFKWKSLLFNVMAPLMFLTLLNSPLLDRIWGNKPLSSLGRHGFSIYLLHWPIIESFSCIYLLSLTASGFGHKWIVLSDIVLSMIVIYVLSVIFTRLVVQPANRVSDKASAWMLKG